jgi:hypothetical protein
MQRVHTGFLLAAEVSRCKAKIDLSYICVYRSGSADAVCLRLSKPKPYSADPCFNFKLTMSYRDRSGKKKSTQTGKRGRDINVLNIGDHVNYRDESCSVREISNIKLYA